jgi:hypothetical protein
MKADGDEDEDEDDEDGSWGQFQRESVLHWQ